MLPGPEKGCHGLFGDLPFLFCPDCQGLDRSVVSLDVQDLFASLLVFPKVLFEGQIASVPGSDLAASFDMQLRQRTSQ